MKRIPLIFVALLSIVANAQQFRVLTTSDRILETDPLFSAWLASYVPVMSGVTGLTVSEGSPLGVTTNAGVLALTIPAASGGSAVSRLLGGEAGNWSILSTQASNVTYATMEGATYLDFDSTKSEGVYVDQRSLLASNVVMEALYISGRAYGATGSVDVVFRFGTDGATTNAWHLSTNLTTTAFTLTNTASSLSVHTFDWGILPGTKATNSVRIRAASVKGVWQ